MELLNGRAFRPDTIDPGKPMRERFGSGSGFGSGFGFEFKKNRPVAAFSFSPERIKAVTITYGKEGVSLSAPRFAKNDPQSAEFVARYARDARATEAAALVSYGWLAEKQDTAFRGPDEERNFLLRENPRELMQRSPDAGVAYALVSHPRRNQSVLFNYTRTALARAIEPLTQTSLAVCRVQPGCYSLFNYIVSGRFDEVFPGNDLLVVDDCGIFLVMEQDGDWQEIAFKSSPSGNFSRLLPQMLARRPDATKPLALATTLGPEFPDVKVQELNPDKKVKIQNLFPETMGNVALVPEFLALATD
ncbi:MAG: hypothetical protein LBK99_09855 [Opitutaceae bacterium]|nr:hypothetical protein [Opitutaceae bacterium]